MKLQQTYQGHIRGGVNAQAFIYENSIINFTGPEIYSCIFKEDDEIEGATQIAQKNDIYQVRLCSAFYAVHFTKLLTKSPLSDFPQGSAQATYGVASDMSWTPQGSQSLNKVGSATEKAITRAQAYIRGSLVRKKQASSFDKSRVWILAKDYRTDANSPYPSFGQALRRAGAGFKSFEKMHRLLYALKRLQPEVLDEQDSTPTSKQTALHQALNKGQAERAALLLRAGCRFDIPDAKGLTAFDVFKQSEVPSVSGNETLKTMMRISRSLDK